MSKPADQVSIKAMNPTTPAATQLLAELDAYQSALYPPASLHLLPAVDLARDDGIFLGAMVGEQLVGCGAYVNHAGEYGELKRMYVRPEARGRGIGRQLLMALEAHARAAGLVIIRLETGIWQPEALSLYERAGYVRRGPFGSYPDDPLSVFMEKRLGG